MAANLSDADRAELNRIVDLADTLRLIAERLLGDDDPTGLRYSRDDDEPTAAPTREHFGFTVTGREQRPTNTPAGFASTERRARQVNGRPGSKLPEVLPGVGHASGMGAAAVGAAVVPALRGGGLR